MKAASVVAVVIVALARPAFPAADESPSLLEEASYRSLIADQKATRVGDVLTVIVQEAASATSTADLRGQRSFGIAAQLRLTMGGEHSGSANTETESDGAGRTQRSGRLLAQLSVRVTDVGPNGELLVEGRQSLRINGEEQLITLTGSVRPRDIGSDNTVLSSRIAQARIRFDGRGFVTDQSKPGWLARFFALLGM